MKTGGFAVAFFVFSIFAADAAAPDYWPTEAWRRSTPEAQGMQSKPLAEMLARIQEREWRIDSVTVVRHGYLVLDAYFHPFRSGLAHIVRSNSKSVMSALIGIALQRAEIESVSQPVLDFFADKTVANGDARKSAMRLEHLLTMTAGFDCKDSARQGWADLKKLRSSPDWTRFVLDLPMAQDPGTAFNYCNGVTFLLSAILQKATGMKALDYAKKHLFGPLGMVPAGWPETPRGLTVGYGGLLLTPHDMARFGLLYLNRGKWNGRRIISESWVENSTRRHVAATLFADYGYQWWGDGDYYMGVGARGQYIFVVPAKDLVAVFTADLAGLSFYVPHNLLLKHVLPAASSDGALPADPSQQQALAAAVEEAGQEPKGGIFWDSPEQGVVRDGSFVRSAAPAFSFRLPAGSRRETLNALDQVMRVKSPRGFEVSAFVVDRPAGLALADVGPKVIAERLREVASQVKLMANEAIVLGDGKPAYRSEFAWRMRGWALTSHHVSAFSGNKLVSVRSGSVKERKHAAELLESLRFDGSE